MRPPSTSPRFRYNYKFASTYAIGAVTLPIEPPSKRVGAVTGSNALARLAKEMERTSFAVTGSNALARLAKEMERTSSAVTGSNALARLAKEMERTSSAVTGSPMAPAGAAA
jgi:hypothetical protein